MVNTSTLVRQALDMGVNLLETAAAYGTEALIGKAIKTVPRDRVVIATKALIHRGDEPIPHDLAASLGHPGEPEHPECQRLTADAAHQARAAGKTVSSDMVASTGLPELIFGAARTFAAAHRHDQYVPPQVAAPARAKAPATRKAARRTRRSVRRTACISKIYRGMKED